MSLATTFATPPTTTPRGDCRIKQLLDGLNPGDREVLSTVLDNPEWPGSEIARRLRDTGHQVSDSTLRKHRRHDCTCDR